MNKKQLRTYAKRFESTSDFLRLVYGIVGVLGFFKLMAFFTNATATVISLVVYVGLYGFVYWSIAREWRALLAPPPKPVRKKPPQPKDPT